jgi:phosphoglycerate dehydrogenase-like enzyme
MGGTILPMKDSAALKGCDNENIKRSHAMSKVSILITYGLTSDDLGHLEGFSDPLLVESVNAVSPEEIAHVLRKHPKTQIVYSRNAPNDWHPDWGVRWFQFHLAGIDHLDLKVIPEDIRLTTASGVHSCVVAEHAFALLLALRRRLPRILRHQFRSVWDENRLSEFRQPLLRGQTMGILGYGSIGREVARLAKSFGMKILAYKRDKGVKRDRGFRVDGVGDPDGSIPTAFYDRQGLNEILQRSDIIVSALPATVETENLLDAAAFHAVKSGAIFINMGRGQAVAETALIDALQEGRLAGAALDVFATEPLSTKSPLWGMENVIVSPHVGGFFAQYNDFCLLLFKENLRRYLLGQPLLNEINRNLGY